MNLQSASLAAMTKIRNRLPTHVLHSRRQIFKSSIHTPSFRHSLSDCRTQTLRPELQHATRHSSPSRSAPIPISISRAIHTTRENRMASDADYMSFLDKADQDTGAASATAQSGKKVGTKSVNTAVPKVLEGVEEYYISDSDEPFEVVSLKYDGAEVPSADELKKLLGHDEKVTSVSEKEFDRKGQYKSVVEAVNKAGSGKVQVFRVEYGSTRAEYYVVSVDSKDGRLVGLKALAVES
ncbi:hypothetical protein K469DRAFT_721765 [Zopfia rhizophila CBS 207.26]|uniref:Uncharacterized protein n=1 Tax=Zopfia rhizophila CBS 207.26 TaxID=1314779 RepID=A0A6A6EHQ5_9PEZI|nr:hypothetical protein K469DRAFT_721765 [Zopfia rhizophila CBS 207.26]